MKEKRLQNEIPRIFDSWKNKHYIYMPQVETLHDRKNIVFSLLFSDFSVEKLPLLRGVLRDSA